MIATGKDNSEEMFPIVDEDGNITGAASRGECHGGSMFLHPVVHLHVFNSQGDLFLQKRPAWKDIQPGKWDTAVGGHVDLGENVHQALVREAAEELGLLCRWNHWGITYSSLRARGNWYSPSEWCLMETFVPVKRPMADVSGLRRNCVRHWVRRSLLLISKVSINACSSLNPNSVSLPLGNLLPVPSRFL